MQYFWNGGRTLHTKKKTYAKCMAYPAINQLSFNNSLPTKYFKYLQVQLCTKWRYSSHLSLKNNPNTKVKVLLITNSLRRVWLMPEWNKLCTDSNEIAGRNKRTIVTDVTITRYRLANKNKGSITNTNPLYIELFTNMINRWMEDLYDDINTLQHQKKNSHTFSTPWLTQVRSRPTAITLHNATDSTKPYYMKSTTHRVKQQILWLFNSCTVAYKTHCFYIPYIFMEQKWLILKVDERASFFF